MIKLAQGFRENKFHLPTDKVKPKREIATVSYRLPADIRLLFNHSMRDSGLTGQELIDHMVRHCLADVSESIGA